MLSIKRWAGAGALVGLCAAPLVPTANAATCHEIVAGAGYLCTVADGTGTEEFPLEFDATGGTAMVLGNRFVCSCSSTGVGVDGLKNEAGRNIVCMKVPAGDEILAFSGLATGNRLTQGTFATLHEVEQDRTFLLTCER